MVNGLESDFGLHSHDDDSFSEVSIRILEAKGRGRHTYAVSLGNTCSLRRPGTFGLIAGWGPAASDLTGSYEDVRTRLDGLSIVHSFRFTISVSRGAAITAIRDGPPGIIGSNRKSSGRSPPRRGTIVQPLTGLPEVSTTIGQRILARINFEFA